MKSLGWHAIAFGMMLAAGTTVWWCATQLDQLSPTAAVVLILFAVGGVALFLENSDYMEPEFFKIWKPSKQTLPHLKFDEDLRKAEQREALGAYDEESDEESFDIFDDPENEQVLVPNDEYDDPFEGLSASGDDDYLKGRWKS